MAKVSISPTDKLFSYVQGIKEYRKDLEIIEFLILKPDPKTYVRLRCTKCGHEFLRTLTAAMDSKCPGCTRQILCNQWAMTVHKELNVPSSKFRFIRIDESEVGQPVKAVVQCKQCGSMNAKYVSSRDKWHCNVCKLNDAQMWIGKALQKLEMVRTHYVEVWAEYTKLPVFGPGGGRCSFDFALINIRDQSIRCLVEVDFDGGHRPIMGTQVFSDSLKGLICDENKINLIRFSGIVRSQAEADKLVALAFCSIKNNGVPQQILTCYRPTVNPDELLYYSIPEKAASRQIKWKSVTTDYLKYIQQQGINPENILPPCSVNPKLVKFDSKIGWLDAH